MNTIQYLSLITASLGIFLLTYGRKENGMYAGKIATFVVGNILAFAAAKWAKGGTLSSIFNRPVLVELGVVLLEMMALCVISLFRPSQKEKAGSKLFPERMYDLERIRDFLDRVNILGINADWGDGKSYLIERLCQEPGIMEAYEVINISLLSCRLGEVEANLISEIDRVLQRNGILSSSSKKLKKVLHNHSFTLPVEELLWDQNDTISSSIEKLKKDVSKLKKKLMILFDDIDRVQNMEIVLNMFAISERIASENIVVIYQYEERNLGLDRDYLEKYIPYSVNLTSLSYSRIVEELWSEMDIDFSYISLENVKNLVAFGVYNYSLLPEISKLRRISFCLEHVSIRRVKIFLQEIKAYYEANEAFHTKEKSDILVRTLFIKNFCYGIYEKFEIGKSVTDTFTFSGKDGAYTVWELEKKIKESGAELQEEWGRLLESENNREVYALLAFFPYHYDLIVREEEPQDSSERRTAISNEAEDILKKKESNERIDRIIWNIVGNGHSEYTDMETFARRIIADVLPETTAEKQKEAWNQFQDNAFHESIFPFFRHLKLQVQIKMPG
ncbi:MAG: hypothetical protein Q4F24_17825 [Eubacteriales bacterium]|nr:hypothetical protein [Eubacteriales bacterium]